MPGGFVDDPARYTHSIQNGNVDNYSHTRMVRWLGAVRPHVLTFRQINVTIQKMSNYSSIRNKMLADFKKIINKI